MSKFSFTVAFKSSTDVARKFYKLASKCPVDFDISSCDNHYVVDGKSILGILSLDLSKPVKVTFNDVEVGKKFMKTVEEFVVK